jgi:riboflavin biosynthesis pyrimidine reductase
VILRRIFPASGETVDIDAPDARIRLSALYELDAPEWVRLNLIANVSGSAVGTNGTSETLSNRADRLLLGLIRRQGDLVLAGAASVRSEGYHLPATVPLAVVTASGDLGGHRIDPAIAPGRLFVLCPESAVTAVRGSLAGLSANIIVVADVDGRLRPRAIIAALRDRGFARIVCEGGPALATQLVADQLVDEFCLSTSPSIGGANLPVLGDLEREAPLELVQLLADDRGGLYARWRLQRSEPPRPQSQAVIDESQRSRS